MIDLTEVQARMDRAYRDMSEALYADIFRVDPNRPIVMPPPLTKRERLSLWWRFVREGIARRVLRVDLLSDHECDP